MFALRFTRAVPELALRKSLQEQNKIKMSLDKPECQHWAMLKRSSFPEPLIISNPGLSILILPGYQSQCLAVSSRGLHCHLDTCQAMTCLIQLLGASVLSGIKSYSVPSSNCSASAQRAFVLSVKPWGLRLLLGKVRALHSTPDKTVTFHLLAVSNVLWWG